MVKQLKNCKACRNEKDYVYFIYIYVVSITCRFSTSCFLFLLICMAYQSLNSGTCFISVSLTFCIKQTSNAGVTQKPFLCVNYKLIFCLLTELQPYPFLKFQFNFCITGGMSNYCNFIWIFNVTVSKTTLLSLNPTLLCQEISLKFYFFVSLMGGLWVYGLKNQSFFKLGLDFHSNCVPTIFMHSL